MTRRCLLVALISLAAYLGSFGFAAAADAHQPRSPRRIAVLFVGTLPDREEVQGFRHGLREAGYTEGRDVAEL